jgi:nucleotide-binding universal stress UspA family protein
VVPPSPASVETEEETVGRIVLVATDGTAAAMGALRFAHELERELDCQVEALGVIEPVPVFDAGFMVALPEVELYESRQSALRQEIQSQIEEVTGKGGSWPIRVEAGIPGPRIVKRAEDLGADTILMGLGRHRPMDRMFGTETALQVLRVSHIPILAVPEDATVLPKSAALGVDFSDFSRKAALFALSVLRIPWEAHLVHVMSGIEFLPHVSEQWREEYEEEMEDRLRGLVAGLPVPEGCTVSPQVLEGEPAHELLDFAEGRGIEMLVAGSHGHSFVGRLLMGSVSTRLIRSAHVPVLVVPPADVTEEVLVEDHRGAPRDSFTKANAGRRTTLELDDPDTGAQECGKDFPLWGVDYDPKRDRLNIMLGRSGTVEGHLTHSLENPQEVQILVGEGGRTEALRVRLPRGQVILRVHRD